MQQNSHHLSVGISRRPDNIGQYTRCATNRFLLSHSPFYPKTHEIDDQHLWIEDETFPEHLVSNIYITGVQQFHMMSVINYLYVQ